LSQVIQQAEKEVVRPEQVIELGGLGDRDRLQKITELVKAQVMESLGMEPNVAVDLHQGFFDMGMDSIISVELRNNLQRLLGNQVSLSPTFAFDYPSINESSEAINSLFSVTSISEMVETRTYELEPIAVIGMSCRFPKTASSPEAFWELLYEGVDGTSEIPKQRWDIDAYYDPDPDVVGKMSTRRGGFVKDIDLFDADFFGISPNEAKLMDPQQRLVLEVSWEALERACIAPADLKGSLTGVFIGVSNNDYGDLILKSQSTSNLNLYFSTGMFMNAISGRLSYILGLQGPSMVMDTACSSSLVSVHQACESTHPEI